MKVRTPCVWVGGKTRLANWILPLIDVDCTTYVEPFGGSAALLLNRDPVDVEVYNDIDSALVTFMLCVKHHYHELVREISELPVSRNMYCKDLQWLRSGCPGVLTDIQFAARWWYLNLNSFGGLTGGGFGTSRSQNRAMRNRQKILDTAMAQKRLMNVVIESDGFERIINRYDSVSTLLYCDPPYLGTESVYDEGGGFCLQDHLALAKCLNLCQSRAAISYFAHPLLEILYPYPKWNYSYLERSCNLSRQKRRGNTRMEVLIRNFATSNSPSISS